MRTLLFFGPVLSVLLLSVTAFAAPLHETFIHEGSPTPELIERWSRLPGQRSYLLQLGDPSSYEVGLLEGLRGADRLQLSVTHYPGEDSVPAFSRLAQALPTEFVSMQGTLPTDDEVRRLNAIPFRKLILVLLGYPGIEEAQRLARLKAPVSLTFVVNAYPRYVDRDSLLAIPAQIPLLFATDYWPAYVHMDVLNFLPNPKRIRVTGIYPGEDQMQYLLNIRGLEEAGVEADFDAYDSATWQRFGKLPVQLTSRDHVPSAQALSDFVASSRLGARRLTVDSDVELTAEERRRLESTGLPVEWIHSVWSRR